MIAKTIFHEWWAFRPDGVNYVDLIRNGVVAEDPTSTKQILQYSFATRRALIVGEIAGSVNLKVPDFFVSADWKSYLFGRLDSNNADIEIFNWPH